MYTPLHHDAKGNSTKHILENTQLSMGKKIAALRNLHYFSTKNFAHVMGISQEELFLYEQDAVRPPIIVLHKIASFFGTTIWKF